MQNRELSIRPAGTFNGLPQLEIVYKKDGVKHYRPYNLMDIVAGWLIEQLKKNKSDQPAMPQNEKATIVKVLEIEGFIVKMVTRYYPATKKLEVELSGSEFSVVTTTGNSRMVYGLEYKGHLDEAGAPVFPKAPGEAEDEETGKVRFTYWSTRRRAVGVTLATRCRFVSNTVTQYVPYLLVNPGLMSDRNTRDIPQWSTSVLTLFSDKSFTPTGKKEEDSVEHDLYFDERFGLEELRGKEVQVKLPKWEAKIRVTRRMDKGIPCVELWCSQPLLRELSRLHGSTRTVHGGAISIGSREVSGDELAEGWARCMGDDSKRSSKEMNWDCGLRGRRDTKVSDGTRLQSGNSDDAYSYEDLPESQVRAEEAQGAANAS